MIPEASWELSEERPLSMLTCDKEKLLWGNLDWLYLGCLILTKLLNGSHWVSRQSSRLTEAGVDWEQVLLHLAPLKLKMFLPNIPV